MNTSKILIRILENLVTINQIWKVHILVMDKLHNFKIRLVFHPIYILKVQVRNRRK